MEQVLVGHVAHDCNRAIGGLGHWEEPGLSGDGPCQVPLDGRPYLARVAAALARDISADVSSSLGVGLI